MQQTTALCDNSYCKARALLPLTPYVIAAGGMRACQKPLEHNSNEQHRQ
jgi:uncharacterized membrane protein